MFSGHWNQSYVYCFECSCNRHSPFLFLFPIFSLLNVDEYLHRAFCSTTINPALINAYGLKCTTTAFTTFRPSLAHLLGFYVSAKRALHHYQTLLYLLFFKALLLSFLLWEKLQKTVNMPFKRYEEKDLKGTTALIEMHSYCLNTSFYCSLKYSFAFLHFQKMSQISHTYRLKHFEEFYLFLWSMNIFMHFRIIIIFIFFGIGVTCRHTIECAPQFQGIL